MRTIWFLLQMRASRRRKRGVTITVTTYTPRQAAEVEAIGRFMLEA